MNNVQYVRWFESQRIRWFESLGESLPEGMMARMLVRPQRTPHKLM